MNLQSEKGKFNTASEFVDIAGTFNNWGANDRLSDSDLDRIYEITKSGFTVGQEIAFKFRINGAWNGREEFPGGGPDRTYKVVDGVNELIFWYNDEVPEGTAPTAQIQVDYHEVFSDAIVQFENASLGDVQEIFWSFEGGNPSTSTLDKPKIQYLNEGKFDVTLIVSNGEVSDTLFATEYIYVKERNQGSSWWNETVFYEIFVRSFKDSNGDGIGDIKGIIEKLDYLNDGDPETNEDLGVTGIWLMPINPSPSYHGYDVTDYKAVNPDYGTFDDFKDLLEAAHARGIRVIIDFVINHSSEQHPWFKNAISSQNSDKRNWYRWNSVNPGAMGWHQVFTGWYYGYFWSGMPDLNYEEEQVKEAIFDAADFWLNEVGVDGFRLDAVKYILEEGNLVENTPTTINFWKEYQTEIKELKPDAYSVGEAWASTTQVIDYVNYGGLDHCFDFDLAFRTVDAVNFENSTSLTAQMQLVYNLYPHLQFATFLRNHDLNRLKNDLGNSDDRVKTAAAILLTLPGTPYIYYGEEIGMTGVKPDDVNVRRPMQWEEDAMGGFTSHIPWTGLGGNVNDYNVHEQQENENSILNHYKKLIQIRNEHPVLKLGGFHQIESIDSRVIAFERDYEGQSLLVMISLTSTPIQSVNLDLRFTTLTEGSYMAQNLMDGVESAIEINPGKSISGMSFKPREVKVLSLSGTVASAETSEQFSSIKAYPNPSSNYIHIDFANEDLAFKYLVYNIYGKLVSSGNSFSGEPIPINYLGNGLYFIKLNGPSLKGIVSFLKID